MCLGSQAFSHAAKNGLYLIKGAFPYLQIPCICTTESSQKQEQKLEKSISHTLKSETLEEHRKDSSGKSYGVLEGGRKIKRWETGTLKKQSNDGWWWYMPYNRGQPALQSQFQDRQRHTEKSSLGRKKKREKTEQTKRKKIF